MRRDGTHAAKVHELLFAAAKERVEAGAKEVDREIIVLALDAGSPEGGHAFAADLDEHNRNVARWREIEARLAQEAEAGEEPAEGAVQTGGVTAEGLPAATD